MIPLHGDNVEATGETGTLDQKFREATDAMRFGDRSRAQELFEQVIRSDPKYPMAHLNLGSVLMMQNKTTEAVAILTLSAVPVSCLSPQLPSRRTESPADQTRS